jgi:hypothetical protein
LDSSDLPPPKNSKPIGQHYFRDAGFQWPKNSKSLYLIGDTYPIQSAKPSEYYLPGLMQSELTRTWKLTVWALLLLVLGIGFIVFLLAH